MKSSFVFVVVALLVMIFFCGCSAMGSHHVIVKGSWKASGLDMLKNPVPITAHLDLVNNGDGDATDVQMKVSFSYNKKVVATDTVYFGTIKAGESIVKDELIMVPVPANPDGDLIDMDYTMSIDGKEVTLTDT